jgi:hypothetical protein
VGNVFHAGDGNMHPLILFDANKPGDLETLRGLGAEILKLCVEVGGCLTGEHGVGIEKRDLMSVQFAPADMEAQMRVKDVFDPKWLLNPAKVFPLGQRHPRRAAGRSRGAVCPPDPPRIFVQMMKGKMKCARPSEAELAEAMVRGAGPLVVRGGGTRTLRAAPLARCWKPAACRAWSFTSPAR